jgi:hypothetical protein
MSAPDGADQDSRDSGNDAITVADRLTTAPLVIEFAPGSVLQLEQHRPSQLPIAGNGPPGTFVLLPDLKISLPTDQVVFAADASGCARVGFGGMRFTGIEEGRLIFARVRELRPETELSPARSHRMTLAPEWLAAVYQDGRLVWTLAPQSF